MLKIKEMKPEDKDLLLKDLCGRLPYKIICQIEDELIINDNHFYDCTLTERHIELFRNHKGFYIKPYLRPMSSMTDEEILDFLQIPDLSLASKRFINDIKSGNFGMMVNMSNYARNIDWLNKNMFDFRELIPKGLAIEVTEDNNPYKDKD